jgi:hypothetical protein
MSARPFIISNSIYITTVAFAQLFEGLEIREFDVMYGSTLRRFPVQVSLDTKERLYYQLKHGGFKALEQQDTRLPRISIQLTDINLRIEDYTGKEQERILFRGNDELKRDIQPVPVAMSYTVGIWAKNWTHYAQIVENILPLFDPYATVEVRERNLDIARELQFTLNGLSQGSNFKVTGNDQKIIRGEATFTAKSYMYKVMREVSDEFIEKVYATLIDISTPINSTTISISGQIPI